MWTTKTDQTGQTLILFCHVVAQFCRLQKLDRVKRIWYLSPMRAAKVQASLRIRAVSPEPSLLAHTSSKSRGTFRQKARSLAPLNGWACAVKICHDGMLEDTNSLDAAQLITLKAVHVSSFSSLCDATQGQCIGLVIHNNMLQAKYKLSFCMQN